jgi:CHAT domain-containing protein
LLLATTISCRRNLAESEQAVYQSALTSFRKGDIKIALERARDGLARCGSATELCWKFRLLEADSLISSKPSQALGLLRAANSPSNRELAARRDMVEGWALYALSDNPGAEKKLEQARHLAETAGSPILLAEVEVRQASVLRALNRLDEAETILHHALDVSSQVGDIYVQSLATGTLGRLRLSGSFRYEEAVYWFEQSLSLSRRIGASALTAQLVGNLGTCYYYLGDFEKALANFAEAEAEFAKIGNLRSRELWLGNRGAALLEMEEFGQAIDSSNRALEMAKSVEDKPRIVDWLINLAQANIELGNLDEAEKYNQEAHSLAGAIKALRQQPYIIINAALIAQKRKQFEQAEKAYRSIADFAVKEPAAMLAAQGGLGTVYADAGQPLKADKQFRTTLATIENQPTRLASVDDRISYFSRLVRFYQNYVDFLVQQGEMAHALEVVESSRARILLEHFANPSKPRSVSALQLQTLARSSHRIFLSYWLAPKRSFVWAITAKDVKCFILPPDKEIRKTVATYRTMIDDIRDPLASHSPAGPKLTQMLLGPIHDAIPPGSHLVVVPDGALHSLNFATLPALNNPGKYWIEEVTLAVAPSLALLLSGRPGSNSNESSLLAIGDPESPGAEYPRLPNAQRELQAIAQLFPPSRKEFYRGSAAQPAVYRRSNPVRFSFIHFAAHASANRMAPLDSALILSREHDSYALTAREIRSIPLNAKLVSLSSCRSAGSRDYAGEGLVGLAWAFLDAGARNVVAGIWDVDDESTSRLMSSMYQSVKDGSPPDDALRAAQLTLVRAALSPYHKPYYWGPFELYLRSVEP